ncbi:MAG: hypothetical protein GEV03_06765 [Streptosporangiales bacterium]|nr:hypothetical protein [Streptosporangiales bacterium]
MPAAGIALAGHAAFTGLWERWRDRTRSRDDPEALLWTCSIVTTEARGSLAWPHDPHRRVPWASS